MEILTTLLPYYLGVATLCWLWIIAGVFANPRCSRLNILEAITLGWLPATFWPLWAMYQIRTYYKWY